MWQFSRLHKATLGLIGQDLEHALLEPDIDIDSTDSIGRTALLWAAKRNDITAAALLIDAKASVNKVDDHGNTPLLLAPGLPCLKLLLNAGADAKAMNRFQDNALHRMAYRVLRSDEQSQATRLLVSAGADMQAKNKSGSTPLALCTEASWVDVFLDHGADINAVDDDGDTCLNNALFHQREHVVALLLRRGAACHLLNKNGDSFLHYAAKYGNSLIIRCLDAANLQDVDTETRNKQGKTPYQTAGERESKPEGFLVRFTELLAGIRARTQGRQSGTSGSASEDWVDEIVDEFVDAVEQQ